jgi:acyl-CoA hydrolase
MASVRFDISNLASVLPPGGLTFVQGCSGESALLAKGVAAAGDALGAMTFTGVFVPGLNRTTYLANPVCRVRTFFMTPELRAAGDSVDFLPFCYADILAHLRMERIDAALFTVSPPDQDGNCSFGPVVDFLAELWPKIPVRIAHINPALPRTHSHFSIPFAELTAYIEAEQPLSGGEEGAGDPAAAAIASRIAPFIKDGATLQTGLGKVPGAILRSLVDRKDLRIHSGLIGDATLDLVEAGALAPGAAVTAGVAIGSKRLYAAIGGPAFAFRPVSYTHNAATIAAIKSFVAINSAIEVDLFGQAFAELTPKGLMSGPGGASDFARGAKAGGGLRIVALPASAGGGAIGRIVPPGAGAGPASLGRMDVDIVVTEYGAADLRGLGHQGRARALIEVAAPNHREELSRGWRDYARRL